jgi:hypothetical protein
VKKLMFAVVVAGVLTPMHVRHVVVGVVSQKVFQAT